MVTPPAHPSFSFHIEGAEPSIGHAVPAAVLVQVLQHAQQAFELIGIHVEGRSVKVRARVPAATSKRFSLICQVPVAGSYALPVLVGGDSDLFDPEQARRAFDIFKDVMEAVSTRSAARLPASLPDERIRRRVLELIKGMAPSAGAAWTLGLRDDADVTFASLDASTPRFVQEMLVPAEQRVASQVVTGELKSIDFIARKLTIIYPPTRKELDCLYSDEAEELLIERRRDLIQVTGRVVLDDAGQPKQLIDVTDIRDLDLSAFELAIVEDSGIRLSASPPLTLEVVSDESQQLLCVDEPALEISAYSPTRESLLQELNEQIVMLWREYALADDADLDGPARALKAALLQRFTEVADAAKAE